MGVPLLVTAPAVSTLILGVHIAALASILPSRMDQKAKGLAKPTSTLRQRQSKKVSRPCTASAVPPLTLARAPDECPEGQGVA